MRVAILPGKAKGSVAAPASKSMAHRLLICAGLSRGTSRISGVMLCEDVLATIDCLRALGASCAVDGDTVTVTGAALSEAAPVQPLCCRESGSTLRFFIPVALLCGRQVTFTGTEKLLSRPLDVYRQLCAEKGFSFSHTGRVLQVQGRLKGGTFRVPGNISSQFITGLLFALPLTDGDSCIRITTPLESRSYVDLTIQALQAFGIRLWWQDEQTIHIPGGQRYQAADMTVEGDYSGAAFYAAMNALGSDIEITGLSPDSLQGDRVCREYFRRIREGNAAADVTDCPDLAPVLMAFAAMSGGARLTGTRRLRFKESDRGTVMAEELEKVGVRAAVDENEIRIGGEHPHAPAEILQGHNDHRIVMALAVLCTRTGGVIEGAEAVRKSFPGFWDAMKALGAGVTVL